MSIEIRESSVTEMLANAGELFQEHWEEITLNKRVMVLKPNEQPYRNAEANDLIFILAAWEGAKLVAYSVNFVLRHLHYADLIYVQNDLLFVSIPHRHGRLGYRMIKETERLAKERGGMLMLWHAKENTPLAAILPRLGCGVQDIIYSKEL